MKVDIWSDGLFGTKYMWMCVCVRVRVCTGNGEIRVKMLSVFVGV